MTKYRFSITIPANIAAPVNVAAAAIATGAVLPGSLASGWNSSYLPACKLSFQMGIGSTGTGYYGDSNLLYTGANADDQIFPPQTAGQPGGSAEIDSFQDYNALNLAQYNLHGANPGDTILVSYQQA